MNENEFEVLDKVKDYYTYYFIESHLNQIYSEIEVILDTSHKGLKSLRKILEKEILEKNCVYIISVYGIDFKPNIFKKKEIKEINSSSVFPIKLVLKQKKNKFESQNYIILTKDNFNPKIEFKIHKKLFGKELSPPEALVLTNLQIIQIFRETLLNNEKKNINDSTYQEFLKFGYNLINYPNKYDLILFIIIYIDILNSDNLQLIKDIFSAFDMNSINRPLKTSELIPYIKDLSLLYNNQILIFDKIKKIDESKFHNYLVKFYTIQFYFYTILENYEICDSLMKDLRDNNPFDKLIMAKLYLSEYSQFYNSIPISDEMKVSLMGNFIDSSQNYNELLTSLSLISSYINKNFVNTLLIIADNMDKIYNLCCKDNSCLNLNDYIIPDLSDDLSKIQSGLEIILKYKLEKKYKSINININTWDIYLSNDNNSPFFEYLKYYLLEESFSFDELVNSFKYISKYNKKDFIDILSIIIHHYNKINDFCFNKKIHI